MALTNVFEYTIMPVISPPQHKSSFITAVLNGVLFPMVFVISNPLSEWLLHIVYPTWRPRFLLTNHNNLSPAGL